MPAPDEYKALTAADVADDQLVAKRLDNLAREVHAGFELLSVKLDNFANRRDDDADRVEELERRLAVLEAAAG